MSDVPTPPSPPEPPEENTGRPFTAVLEYDALRWFISTARTVAEELKLIVSDSELWAVGLNPSTALMGTVRYHPSSEAGEVVDGTTAIGINFDRFDKVVSSAKAAAKHNDGLIELSLSDGQIIIEAGAFEYALTGIVPDSIAQPPDVQHVEFDAALNLETDHLETAISAVELAASTATIHFDGDHFHVSGRGDDDRSEISLSVTDSTEEAEDEPNTIVGGFTGGADGDQDIPDPLMSTFAVDFLSRVARGFTESEEIVMGMGDNHPMSLGAKAFGNRGLATWMLSPRLDRGGSS